MDEDELLRFRCDICGVMKGAEQMAEREIVGKLRQLCPDCHTYMKERDSAM